MDWWPLSGRYNEILVEWSPHSGNNLRAKERGNGKWVYSQCKKAKYALFMGERLIMEKGAKKREIVYLAEKKVRR